MKKTSNPKTVGEVCGFLVHMALNKNVFLFNKESEYSSIGSIHQSEEDLYVLDPEEPNSLFCKNSLHELGMDDQAIKRLKKVVRKGDLIITPEDKI